MSAANFSIPNTKKHYCIFNDDDFYWESTFNDDIDYLREELKEKITKLRKVKKYASSDFGVYDTNLWLGRNRKAFLTVRIYDKLKYDEGISHIKIHFVWESGYYEGVMFDYEIEDGYDDMSSVYKYTEYLTDRIIKIYEDTLEKFAPVKLERVGSFSNGETIYKIIQWG